MIRDLSNEPVLATGDIQGDILPGLLKRHEDLIFFAVDDVEKFSDFVADLPVTTMQEVLDQRALAASRKAAGIEGLVPAPGLNVAFTYAGLSLLGVEDLDTAADIDAFRAGMAARTGLQDPDPTTWSALGPSTTVHGVFVVTGSTPAEIDNVIALRLVPAAAHGWHVVHEELGQVRPEPVHGHEHFGYADGVSQPGVRGTLPDGSPLTVSVDPAGHPEQGMLGQDLLWPGEFVFGYESQVPFVDPDNDEDFTLKGPIAEPPIPFMKHGAFMVFRRLAQLVPEFDQAVQALADSTAGDAQHDEADADLMGAQLVGRWKSGAPLINAPLADDPTIAEGTGAENDFEFGGDRSGTSCPWAAHIRKAYPRDDVRGAVAPTEDAVTQSEAFTQTHRMMRRGIAFGPELSHTEALNGVSDPTQQRGLLFKCYVTSIDDQFEFVQQAWIDNGDFVQPGSGIDPLIGQPSDAAQPFLGGAPISGDPDRKPQLSFGRFVHMQGGEYFFAPSVKALHALAKAQPSA